jgi:hypothetical protein
MKNAILFFILLFSVIISNAQFNSGDRFIGGQLGGGFSNYNESGGSPSYPQRYSYINTSLSLSRFTSATRFVSSGFTYSYNYNHTDIGSLFSEQSYYMHNIGAFVSGTRLHQLAKKFYLGFTGTGGIGYGFGKARNLALTPMPYDYYNSKSYNLYVSGGMGLFYQLGKRWLLSGNLSNLLNLSFSHTNNTYYSTAGIISTVTEKHNDNFGISSGLNGFSFNNIVIDIRYQLKK